MPEERASQLTLTAEGDGYSMTLLLNKDKASVHRIFIEHPLVGGGRTSVLVRLAFFCDRLMYKFNDFISGPDTALVVNIIERKGKEIIQAITAM